MIPEQQGEARQGESLAAVDGLAQPVEEAVAPSGGERIGPALALGIDLAQGAAGHVRHGRTVLEAAVAIGEALDLGLSLLPDALGVDLEQGGDVRALLQSEAVLILRDELRPLEVVAAEVEEAQGHVAHPPGAVPLRQRAVGEVPVGHVVARIAQDLHPRQEGRGEVHPALIHEQPLIHLVQAPAVEAARPPVEERQGALVEREAEEAQVVDARQQDLPLRRHGQVFDRRRQVGRQHGVGAAQSVVELPEVAEDQDVGIEVAGPVAAQGAVEVEEEPGLDRGGQLEDRVAEREMGEAWDAELVREGDGERLVLIAMPGLRVVDDEHADLPLGVPGEERTGERPRVSEVVVRDDGAGQGRLHSKWTLFYVLF